MYTHRTLEEFTQTATTQFPVILVTGARQVGKTTFLKHLSDVQRTYVTLDDPLLLNLAKDDPALFLQRFTPPVLIDEIQYAPELLPHIKMAVDRDRRIDVIAIGRIDESFLNQLAISDSHFVPEHARSGVL